MNPIVINARDFESDFEDTDKIKRASSKKSKIRVDDEPDIYKDRGPFDMPEDGVPTKSFTDGFTMERMIKDRMSSIEA